MGRVLGWVGGCGKGRLEQELSKAGGKILFSVLFISGFEEETEGKVLFPTESWSDGWAGKWKTQDSSLWSPEGFLHMYRELSYLSAFGGSLPLPCIVCDPACPNQIPLCSSSNEARAMEKAASNHCRIQTLSSLNQKVSPPPLLVSI